MENIQIISLPNGKLQLKFFPPSITERKARDEFVGIFRKCLRTLAWNLPGYAEFEMLTAEMVRNINDHAGCFGEATFIKFDNCVYFNIRDYGRERHKFSLLRRAPSSKAGSGFNRRLGLMTIQSVCRNFVKGGTPFIDLRINSSKGFSYDGFWFYKY